MAMKCKRQGHRMTFDHCSGLVLTVIVLSARTERTCCRCRRRRQASAQHLSYRWPVITGAQLHAIPLPTAMPTVSNQRKAQSHSIPFQFRFHRRRLCRCCRSCSSSSSTCNGIQAQEGFGRLIGGLRAILCCSRHPCWPPTSTMMMMPTVKTQQHGQSKLAPSSSSLRREQREKKRMEGS